MLFFDVLAGIIATAVFLYGAIHLFQRGMPLYFQIIICAVGCFALGQFANLVSILCGDTGTVTEFSTSSFCYFGAGMSMLTANTGALDKSIVRPSRRADIIALAAPVLYFALLVPLLAMMIPADPFFGVACMIFLAPSGVNCYFNLRHLLSEPDEGGILKRIRLTDIFTLIFAFLSFFALFAYRYEIELMYNITEIVTAVILSASTFVAVKEAKSWKI